MDSKHQGSSPQLCPAIRRDGNPCQAQAGVSGLCIGHREGAGEARRKGGLGRSAVARADKRLSPRLRNTAALIERAMVEVHQGQLDPRQANAIAALAGALMKVIIGAEVEERVNSGPNGGPVQLNRDIKFTLKFDNPGAEDEL